MLCVGLGCHVVIGVGRLIVRFLLAYVIPSFLLDVVVRLCLVMSDCSHNSCMLHIAKTGPFRCCPYTLFRKKWLILYNFRNNFALQMLTNSILYNFHVQNMFRVMSSEFLMQIDHIFNFRQDTPTQVLPMTCPAAAWRQRWPHPAKRLRRQRPSNDSACPFALPSSPGHRQDVALLDKIFHDLRHDTWMTALPKFCGSGTPTPSLHLAARCVLQPLCSTQRSWCSS